MLIKVMLVSLSCAGCFLLGWVLCALMTMGKVPLSSPHEEKPRHAGD